MMPTLFVFRQPRIWLLIVVAVAIGVLLFIGRRAVREARQVQSYAVLQTMRDAVERIPADRRNAETLRVAVESIVGGHDAWGNPVRVFVREEAGRVSYVLVSYGADGSSNAANSEEYFAMKDTDIRDDVRKDIVVRDGELVTFAGK